MSSKPLVMLGLCVVLLPGISGAANTTEIDNAVNEKEKKQNILKPVEFSAFVERVLSEHPTILSAQADIDVAQALADGSEKPLYNPELEVEAEDATVATYTVGITQTIDWYGKRAARFDEAGLILQTAREKLALVKEQVVGELMAVIVQYLSSRDMNVVVNNRVKLMDRFYKLTKNRQRAGDIGQYEVDTAMLALTEAIILQAEFRSKLIKASGEFKVITGLKVNPSMRFPSILPSNISAEVDLEKLASRHPLVMAARSRVNAAKARTFLTRQERRADPSLGVVAGTEDNETLVALRFSMPLQVRNDFRDKVVASGHAAVREEQKAQNTYRQVLGRVEAAKDRYRVMSGAWKLWSQSGQKTLRSHLENLEKLWESGEISTTQYLVLFQQSLNTQLSGTKLKGDIWQAWIDWLIAAGTVNKWLSN